MRLPVPQVRHCRRVAVLALLVCATAARGQGVRLPLDEPADIALRNVTIPSQVPLRIATVRRTKLKCGSLVTGTLTESVYVGTQLVLPANSQVTGLIVSTPPVPRHVRTEDVA